MASLFEPPPREEDVALLRAALLVAAATVAALAIAFGLLSGCGGREEASAVDPCEMPPPPGQAEVP